MRKIISLLMNLAALAMVISSVDSARPVKGIACRKAGGECYRNGKANRICEKYDDEANDCGGSRKCCLATTDDPRGTIRKALQCTASCDVGTCTPRRRCAEEGRGSKCGKRCVCCTKATTDDPRGTIRKALQCTASCDVGTCTPRRRCAEQGRGSKCGKRCVCCTKVKPTGQKKGNAMDEKDDSSEGKGPRGPRKGQQNQNIRPNKVKQGKCAATDDCTMKGGKCKTKCNKNADPSLCSGDCTCCGICEAKSKCSRYDGVCKKSCDGTERTIKGGCKKKKKCTCCAPKCQQNGCQGQCVSKRKECNGQFIKNGCGGLKCHCCNPVDRPTTTPPTTSPTPSTTTSTTTPRATTGTAIGDRLFCPEECGRANLTVPRIVGGQVATRLEYPWVAYITITGGGEQDVSCGGAIINRDHVLTAAHCFGTRDLATSTVTVFLAEHDIDSLTETEVLSIFAQEVFIHPEYKADGRDTEEHDIAMLYLGGLLDFGLGVQPICLGTEDDFRVGQEVVIVGWGLTDFANSSSGSNLLREVAVSTIALDQCIMLYQNAAQRQFVNENMICTLTSGKDACSGDSGGPVITRVGDLWVLIGIVSFGNGCADPLAPGVHTNVANYLDWMTESIGGAFC